MTLCKCVAQIRIILTTCAV